MSKSAALKLPTGLARSVSMFGLAGRVAKVTGQTQSACYKRIRRQLIKWLGQDVAEGHPPWMYRQPGRARNIAWRINLPALRKCHPTFFEDISPKEIEDRVEVLEAQVVELEWARDAMAEEIGKLRGQVAIARRASG